MANEPSPSSAPTLPICRTPAWTRPTPVAASEPDSGMVLTEASLQEKKTRRLLAQSPILSSLSPFCWFKVRLRFCLVELGRDNTELGGRD